MKLTKADIPPELVVIKPVWASLKVATIILPIWAVAYLIGSFWQSNLVLTVALFVLLGIYINKVIFLLHDLAHETSFTSKAANSFWGEFLSGFVITNFGSFKELHLYHHSRYGETDDPQGLDYLNYHHTTAGKLFWHLTRPLVGYNFFKILQLNKARDKERKKSKTYFFLSVIAQQGIVFLLLSSWGQHWYIYFLYPMAAGSVGLFCSQIRGFCEHVAFTEFASEKAVRSHKFNLLEWFFLYDNGFNYHVEHHMIPSLPSANLKAFSKILADKNGLNNENYSTSMFKTILTKFRDVHSA